MKMNVKNKELYGILECIESLRDLKLDGATSLAIVEFREDINSKIAVFEKTNQDILEAHCMKNEDGSSKKKRETVGNTIQFNYEFENDQIALECSKKLNEVGEIEVELSYTNVPREKVVTLSCSPIQMQGLLMLTK